jgi:hypothetical protein
MKPCLLMFAAALVAACSTTPVPGVCCIGPDSCNRLGLSEDRPCPAGQACTDFQCVVPSCSTQGCAADAPVCDVTTDACTGCSEVSDCSRFSETDVCDLQTGSCVECLTQADCTVASKPICDGGSCRGCRLDTECPSGACDSGTCISQEAVLYLSVGGSDDGTCSREASCKSIQFAVTQSSSTRNHIVISNGMYVGTNSVTSSNTSASSIHIHGHGATLAKGPSPEGMILGFNLAGSIRDLNFEGGTVVLGGVPIVAERVTFVRTDLTVAGNAIIRDFVISDAPGIGMYLVGSVTAERGVIRGGQWGLVNDNNGYPVLDISNILIFGTSGRAVELGRSTGKVRFVSVAHVGAQQSTGPRAFECGPGLTVESSIIWTPGGGAQLPLSGGCSLVTTIVGPRPVPGASNADPRFVDPITNNFHLKPDSPAREMVDTGPAVDFEGDPRPRGPRFDIGADEAP